MMVEVDFNTMTTVAHRVSGLPKAAQKATYNLDDSWQRARSTVTNMIQFVTGRLKPYQGMMALIHRFYDAVRTGSPSPVPRERGLEVVETMDAIFEQLKIQPLRHDRINTPRAVDPGKRRVLVTGGTGFVGRRLVSRLLAEGHAVRVLARKLADVSEITAAGAEVFWGDVGDLKSFDEAVAGCHAIVHLAAGTSGSEADSRTATLDGTSNLLELCRRHRPQKLVYVSSCSVYGIADCRSGALVSETSPLERHPERRGAYSASKQGAEHEVAEFMRSGTVRTVILRPGTIYGPGGELYTPMMGFAAGSLYLVIGPGRFVLPLVYVDNVVDAIVRSMDRPEADGEVFNVVDAERLTKREYMNRVIRRIDPGARVVYLPYSLLYAATWLQELLFGMMKRRPVLTRYRLTCSQKKIVYDGAKIAARLGWTQPRQQREALSEIVASELAKQIGRAAAADDACSSRAA
jgi:nucleoside-diphosphate-sugar epimerase